LKELHARTGMTTIYVTHDQEEALVLADRIVVMNRGVIEQVGPPQEVYLDPTTRFVAAFVGNTTLVDGTAESVDRGNCTAKVSSDLGVTLTVPVSVEILKVLKAGDRVTLSIRPEAVRARAASAGDAPISARVVKSAFLGSRYEVWLDINGRQIRAEASGLADLTAEHVGVSIDSQLVRVVRA
jgi:ABC-type Fe3+/spermidine/putrescine transport system ATPase subunit